MVIITDTLQYNMVQCDIWWWLICVKRQTVVKIQLINPQEHDLKALRPLYVVKDNQIVSQINHRR